LEDLKNTKFAVTAVKVTKPMHISIAPNTVIPKRLFFVFTSIFYQFIAR
jgi:hypothetical protein